MESDTNYLPIIIGIVSSLIATAIFVSFSELCRRLIFPWIADKIYKGVRIDGAWKIKSIDGDEEDGSVMQLNISQWGEKISGSYFHDDGEDKTHYKINGVLKNMYLMAYMEPSSSKMIDACALLMHVEYGSGHLLLQGSLLHKTAPGKLESWDNLVFKQKNS